MTPRWSVLLLAFVLVALVPGCEQAGAKPSGKLARGEATLLASLPAGNSVLFGGNYMRFQNYLQSSPLNKLMSSMNQVSPGMTEWMDCFIAAKNVTMLGGVTIGPRVDMRFVMKGIDLEYLEACGKRAKYPTKLDADRKFLSLEMPNPLGPMKVGYLVLPNGAIYTRQTMPFPPTALVPVDRAALEAEVASLAKRTAADDKALVAQLGGLDRSKAMWFVGSGAGTPVADKLGLVYGTFDIASGLSIDVTMQITDRAIAKQISDGIPQMKNQAAQLGPALASVIKRLQFQHKGDRLRFVLTIDDPQLQALIDQLGPMMSGAAAP